MIKHGTGNKYIIEVGTTLVDAAQNRKYFIKGFNTLVFDDNGSDQA